MKYIENFPFLQKRFASGFFLRFVSRHYLLIAYTASRHGYAMSAVLGELFAILYTNRIISLNKYDSKYIGKSVYDKLLDKNPDLLPLSKLSDEQRCIVVFFILYFKHRSASLDVDSELLRIVKILLVTKHIYREKAIIISLFKVKISNYVVGLADGPTIMQTVKQYSAKFSDYACGVPKRRNTPGYNATINEYHSFLVKFYCDPLKYLTDPVIRVVNEYYTKTKIRQTA